MHKFRTKGSLYSNLSSSAVLLAVLTMHGCGSPSDHGSVDAAMHDAGKDEHARDAGGEDDDPPDAGEGDVIARDAQVGDGSLGDNDAAAPDDASSSSPEDAGDDAAQASCGSTPAECAATWEETASDCFDALRSDSTALAAFLKAMPKGGDLRNHLSAAVYAETYLEWARGDGDCINGTSYAAVAPALCSVSNLTAPSSGSPLFDTVVRAWSMKDFVPGTSETSLEHYLTAPSKFGLIYSNHRNDALADLAKRAADENEVYVEAMLTLGSNLAKLATTLSSGTLGVNELESAYDQLLNAVSFSDELAADIIQVTDAQRGYRTVLECAGPNPPAACAVNLRFVAQVSRTGSSRDIFGRLIGAFEMAKQASQLVAVSLASPEHDSSAINNYALHMQMLAFLHKKYTATADSPLHVTLPAGELVPAILPPGSNANTFHIHDALLTAEAERIGHGVDVMSENNSSDLLQAMVDRNVLVEICLSSNAHALGVAGDAHPLKQYLAHGVPVALATDNQGISRSSMSGEYLRAALDQDLGYRQLKLLSRNSLEHAFLPGASLWTAVGQAVAACSATAGAGVGEQPGATCSAFLSASQRAQAQWELERRFLAFESALNSTP